MAPNFAKRLLCSNKNAEEQRQEEWELALNQLKSGNRQYKESISAVGQRGVKMADAIEIAKTINALTESLKNSGVSAYGDAPPDLNSSLMEASEKLQAYTEQLSRTSAKPVQKIVYYDQSSLPNSPQRFSPEKTPKRSNCRGADDLCSATSAFSCASGYLATIGDEDSECFMKTESQGSPMKSTMIPVGKKGTRLSLDLRGSPTKSKGNRKIRIVNGKSDITILGSGVKELTLQTRSSSSSAENHGPVERVHESRGDIGEDKQSSRGDFGMRAKCKSANKSQPMSAPTDPKQGPLENLVLGAMKTPSRMSPTKARLKQKGVLNDTIPSSSSSVSEFLPSDGHDMKKCKSVKTGDEKGFEVFLDQTTDKKRYSSDKLRERASFSEKLQRNRREILDIKQDLELCSMLLDKCNDGTTQRYRSTPRGVLDRIDEHVKPRFASPPRGVKATRKYVDESPSHRAIIRE